MVSHGRSKGRFRGSEHIKKTQRIMVERNTDNIGIRTITPEFITALRELQKAMEGEAERAGLYTEDDVVALVKEIRSELATERQNNLQTEGESQS